MEINQRTEYPSWLVKRKLTHVRNRYVHLSKSSDSTQRNNDNYTWYNCFQKAKTKLNYRFHNRSMDAPNHDWDIVISFIKARLVQHFDDEQAWRIAEYKVLEKINKQDFHCSKAPNLLWHYVAVDKTGKSNKLLNRKPPSQLRTEKYDWNIVISNSKRRMENHAPDSITDEELFWQLCIKANLEKIRRRFRWFDWNSAIQRNYRKFTLII